MTFQFWLLYCGTLFLASIIPGPSMLLALNHGMLYGAKRTMVTASGNVTASLVQAGISIAGLGALLVASQTLFLTIKYLGALYLIYIGIKTFRAPNFSAVQEDSEDNRVQLPIWKMFLDAFLVAMGNPKAILFFTALFPQFVNLSTISAIELFGAFVSLAIIAFLCFMIYALGGEKVIALFKRDKIGKRINKLIGTIFIGSGLAILFKR